MNVAILVRVSTDRQATDRQITELTSTAASNGWTVTHVIEEAGISGASNTRPGLQKALDLARTNQIRKVVVHEVSRIARKNSTAHSFIEELTDLGVSLYWHAQRIESLLPDGRRNPAAAIMFALLAEMARSERETMRERVISGLAEARRKGIHLGRPRGTTYSREDLISRHPKAVRLIRDGQSVRNAAKIAGVSPDTITRLKKALNTTTV
jgi:DNA invertase Pin-like site-specific DNA recombinase